MLSAFGDRLKRIRESLDKTQQELADMLDVSKQTLLRYEKGQREPEISFIYRLIDLTKANAAYVFMGQEPVLKEGDRGIIFLDDAERCLVELFRELKEQDRERLIATLEILIDKDHTDRTDKLRTLKRPVSSNR